MRRSNVLLQQHAGKMFQNHWKVQRKRVVRDSGVSKIFKEVGCSATDALDVINEDLGTRPSSQELRVSTTESTSQDFLGDVCSVFRDHNVLVEGLEQAKVLTNTVQLEEGTLPSTILKFCNTDDLPSLDKLVRRSIKSSILYDAEQKKLPKRTDPERPAWNFPRDYGITDRRKNFLLCNKLVQLCTSFSPQLCPERRVFNGGAFKVPLKRDNKDVLLSLRADLLIHSKKPLKQIEDPEVTVGIDLPSIDPLLPTVSLEEERINKIENIFPVLGGSMTPYIQSAFVHYNETEVKNLYETEVTESQFLGRSLMKSYTFAVAQARYLYGNDVVTPPSPVVIQCIHTDSKQFHFSVFQLNTLKGDGEIHNIYWSLPKIQLFETCDYIKGRPVLEGYNPDVMKLVLGFFRNDTVV